MVSGKLRYLLLILLVILAITFVSILGCMLYVYNSTTAQIDNYIITLLIVFIFELLCFYCVDKVESIRKSKAFYKELQERNQELLGHYESGREIQRSLLKQNDDLHNQVRGQAQTIKVLEKFIKETFTNVLQNSRYRE